MEEHDASKLITAVAAATVAARRGRRRVDESGGQFVYFIAFLVFLWRREGVADGNISHVDRDSLRGVVSVGDMPAAMATSAMREAPSTPIRSPLTV